MIFIFALLSAPFAIVKRREVNPAKRSTTAIGKYLLYRVMLTGAIITTVLLAALFLIITIIGNNPTAYIGPLATLWFTMTLTITIGILLPWLAIFASYIILPRDR